MLLALKLQAREEEGKGKEGARAKHQVCARSPESRKACLREGMGNRRRKRRRRGGGPPMPLLQMKRHFGAFCWHACEPGAKTAVVNFHSAIS